MAFEVFDAADASNTDLKTLKRPSFYEFLSYSYCYCGLTTGPYYRYKTFRDMLNQENPKQISTFLPAMKNLIMLPFYAVVYLALNHHFPISHIASEEYVKHPLGVVYQLAYLVPTFIGFRWRFYIGWLLAESCCMMLGLGAYPIYTDPKPGLGPTKSIPEENGSIKRSEPDKIDEVNRDTHR